ncbi:hypothetical protein GCM10010193_63620 [Kitasatospora atroaurantiaca]
MYGAGAASYDRLGPRRRAWFPRVGRRSTQPEKSALRRHSVWTPVPCAGDLRGLLSGAAAAAVRLGSGSIARFCGHLDGAGTD